ncbi:MAG: cell division ATP-binding protein FtsE [Leadbetterella sp.]
MSSPVIEVRNAFIYQKDKCVLQNVNFNIQNGEFVYLIGKTGSGKSSLLKTLYAELFLERGKGTVADYQLENLPRSRVPFLRRKLGIVFQDFQLLSDRSIGANLEFFLEAMGWSEKSKIKHRIHEVLILVGLPDVIQKMPHQISGGEQQRIAIARALLNQPEIILADEPTGNLDPEMSVEILKLFFKINEISNTAVLMATHQLDLIERFPKRTLYCSEGRVLDLSEQ